VKHPFAPVRSARILVSFCLTLAAGFARANEPCAPPCEPQACWTMDSLANLSEEELEAIYRSACAGCIPSGFLEGRPLYPPCSKFGKAKLAGTRAIWLGKRFDPCEGTLTNQWRGFRAVKAAVGPGESWLDGGPSIVMDYEPTSRIVWHRVRDEMREISPGLYLGIMYVRKCDGPKRRMFFALEFPCQ
jgi:hypothetical protein